MSHPLRLFRHEKNLPLNRVADALNITEAQLSRIECGRRKCTPKMALLIEQITEGAVPKWALRPDIWLAPGSEGAVA